MAVGAGAAGPGAGWEGPMEGGPGLYMGLGAAGAAA